MRRIATFQAATAASLLLLSACAAAPADPGASTPPSAPGTTTSLPSTPSADMPFLDPSQVVQHVEGTSWSAVTDVRGEQYPDFDRVVLEFAGGPEPLWTVWYKKSPEGNANRVDIAGDAYLYVQVNNVRSGPAKTIDVAGEAVRQVVSTGLWEATQGVLIGVNGHPRPFRVAALAAPWRPLRASSSTCSTD